MLLFSLILNLAIASTPRIESKYLDQGFSSKIYLRPGLISVVEFPQNIIEVRVGNPNNLKVLISTVSPREMTLYFKTSNVEATNLIIKADRKIYVFDVIPSKSTHQDYIKVNGTFGTINNSSNLKVLRSVEVAPQIRKPTKTNQEPKLIESISL